MSLDNFREKVRSMSPLKRAFVSAAMGVGAFGVVAGTAIAAPVLTTAAGLGVSLLGSIMVSSYSDHSRGAFNIMGVGVSKDSLLNVGVFFGSYLFAAPKIVGAAIGLAMGAAGGHGLSSQATMDSPPPPPTVETIDPPGVS